MTPEITRGIRRRYPLFIGSLLPTALVAWRPHCTMRPVGAKSSHSPSASSPGVRSNAAALPHNVVSVAPGIRDVLNGASEFARSRFVELQMAVEPRLVAQVDAGQFHACLNHLVHGAIARAGSGVLVTAIQRADAVEIAVLDDGINPAGSRSGDITLPDQETLVPSGATLSADYHPERGTTIVLRLPQPDWLPLASDADSGSVVSTEL